MALTDIIEKINQEAQKKAQELAADLDARKKKLEAENEIEITSTGKNLQQLFDQQEEKMKTKAEMEGEMEGRNKLLRAKREFIDQLLEKAVEELASSNQYETLVSAMLKNSDAPDTAEIIAAKGKEDITRRAIGNSGKAFRVSEHSEPIKGGFILKTEKMEMDNSFETIIFSQLRPTLEIELNKLLFA